MGQFWLFRLAVSSGLLFSLLGSPPRLTERANEVLDLVPEVPATRFAWPLDGVPSESYGDGVNPGAGYRHLQPTVDEDGIPDGGLHIGADFNAGAGDEDLGAPAYLVADAIAVFVGEGSGRELGRIAIFATLLENGELIYLRYAHLDEVLAVPGESYRAGEIIGRVGKSGWERGFAHLHLDIANRRTFEERFVGQFANPWWYPHHAPAWYVALRFLDPVAFLEEYAIQEGPAELASQAAEGAIRPLDDLPVFWTQDTPVLISHRTRGGQEIDLSFPENAGFAPEWVVLSGVPLSILPPIRPVPELAVPPESNPLGLIPWVAEVPHVTGLQPTTLMVVVGYGGANGTLEHWNGQLVGNGSFGVVSTFAFTDRIRIYPSKIFNILTALAAIAEWQEAHGPLVPGELYSFLEMAGVPDRNAAQFLIGGYLEAGGICASVATLSKTLFIAESRGQVEVMMRFLHAPEIQYAENPLDPAITKLNSDATVGFVVGRPARYGANSDYQFRLAESSPPMYLSFRAALFFGEEPIDPNHPARHRRQPADARLLFTIVLTTESPDFAREQQQLLELRDLYAQFHDFDDGFLGSFNR